jgi:HAD superfamily hydrolase (TIGR01509 family)
MIDTIIFDGEGVVVDTEGVWDMGQEEFLHRRGFVYDRERIKPLLTGRSLVEGVEILQHEYGFDGDPQEQARERAEIVRELFETQVGFVAGFERFFESVREDYKTCIATAMDPALLAPLDRKLGLSERFGGRIYTLDDVNYRSKPHPDLFLHAARELGSTAAQCLVFEDAPHGIEAARRAQMLCVGLTTTYTEDQLGEADIVLSGYEQGYAAVERYTVDNRYGEEDVILLKASLKRGRLLFTDAPENWGQEKLVTARLDELIEQLGLPKNDSVKSGFQPGRVFLRGHFQVLGPKEEPQGFIANGDAAKQWLRIDQLSLVKETMKQLYSKLLVESGSDG